MATQFVNDILKLIFLNENECILIKLILKFVHWSQGSLGSYYGWLGIEQDTSHYLNNIYSVH